jgi:hypothetical protein
LLLLLLLLLALSLAVLRVGLGLLFLLGLLFVLLILLSMGRSGGSDKTEQNCRGDDESESLHERYLTFPLTSVTSQFQLKRRKKCLTVSF